jgi:hypothetical protein
MSLAKEQMIKIIQVQPDDSSYDEILRKLAFARMIECSLGDSQANIRQSVMRRWNIELGHGGDKFEQSNNLRRSVAELGR